MLAINLIFLTVIYSTSVGAQYTCKSAGTFCQVENQVISATDPVSFSSSPLILIFYNSTMPALPNSIFTAYPNISLLSITNSQLRSVATQNFVNAYKLQSLLFKSNPISTLANGTFRNCVNLQSLQVYECQLETIEVNAFMGLKSLSNLVLSSNKLTSLPSSVFKIIDSVKIIDISSNMLTSIDPSLFASKLALTLLNIGNNNFSELPPDMLPSSLNLRSLYINNNKLTSTKTYGVDFFDASSNQLSSLELSGGESTVSVSNNALTKIICPNFSVQRFNAANNSLTSFLCIRDMLNLTELDVSGNSMRKPRKVAFAKLKKLKLLRMTDMKKFVSIPAKAFVELSNLTSLYVAQMPAYKNVKQFLPKLSILGLTTGSFNCTHLQFVANTLGSIGVTLTYNRYQDRLICNVKQNVTRV